MKLNIDCVRDVLLTVENVQLYEVVNDDWFGSSQKQLHKHSVFLTTLSEKLPAYPLGQLLYTIELLTEAEYLISYIPADNAKFIETRIFRLTFAGHEFLEQIRPDDVYSQVKQCLSHTGSFAFSLVSDIARELLAASVQAFIRR